MLVMLWLFFIHAICVYLFFYFYVIIQVYNVNSNVTVIATELKMTEASVKTCLLILKKSYFSWKQSTSTTTDTFMKKNLIHCCLKIKRAYSKSTIPGVIYDKSSTLWYWNFNSCPVVIRGGLLKQHLQGRSWLWTNSLYYWRVAWKKTLSDFW